MLDKLVFDKIFSFIRIYINPMHHGFINGRSTEINLIVYHSYLTYHMNDKIVIDSI